MKTSIGYPGNPHSRNISAGSISLYYSWIF